MCKTCVRPFIGLNALNEIFIFNIPLKIAIFVIS